ncbi:DUF5719 family protein [Microbacterium marinilacus]|uniref:Large extracellular alpha-helical protein n=1 Tax=Microbacterium marinilacus TaxID=415209 RepID=A0ABP7B8R1_9MICO|nr:DUF5719 family protein [Microbacterium marinilacus]MBY0687217.1 large extracellular alpha-helical protein [Microbacterium marinilacus]
MRITVAQRIAGARVLVGALVSAGAVVAVVATAALPWPSVASEPPVLEVTPAPAETVLACDGPVLALGRTAEEADGLSVAAPVRTTVGNDLGGEPVADAIAQPDVSEEGAATRYLQDPDGRQPVSAAAAVSAEPSASDVSGLTASACRPPQMESWIVGGDVATGSTGILLLANPGDVAATVQVTVYGVTGAVTPPAAAAIPIPARTQLAIPLAGIAGGEQKPVLRVTATGAPVRASLQSSLVRTLDPGGVDTQSAVRPALTQIVPGLRIVGEVSGAEGASTIVRLLSEVDTTATITVSETGDADSDREPEPPVELVGGTPVDVDLGGLDEGDYTVAVTAEEPLVAAVWQTTGFGAGDDYAWHTPAPAISEQTLVAVPRGPEPTLSIVNPAEEDVTVSVAGYGDDPEDVVVPAGDAVTLDVDEDRLYTIDPGGAPVHAALGFAGESALAAIAVWPDAARPQPVVVYP